MHPVSFVLQDIVLKLLQKLTLLVTDGSSGMQACADKLERELQLYCDPSKPGSLPVFPDEEPDAAVSSAWPFASSPFCALYKSADQGDYQRHYVVPLLCRPAPLV